MSIGRDRQPLTQQEIDRIKSLQVYRGAVQHIDTAPKVENKFILLYVPSDYGWEAGYWDSRNQCWSNRSGHAIRPTHWDNCPPDPQPEWRCAFCLLTWCDGSCETNLPPSPRRV